MKWHHQHISSQIGGFQSLHEQYVLQMPLPDKRPTNGQDIETLLDAILRRHMPKRVLERMTARLRRNSSMNTYWMYDLDPAEIEISNAPPASAMMEAITFTHKISFPNLEFTGVDFPACCRSFSEALRHA